MSSRLLRMGGWLLLGAAVISLINSVLTFVLPYPAGPSGPPSNVASIIDVLAGILFLFSLPVAYLGQKKVGIVGLCGIAGLWLAVVVFYIILGSIDIVTVASNQAASLAGTPPPYFMALILAGTVLEAVGGLLFGIRTIQARVFPRLIGWLMIVAVILAAIGFPTQGNLAILIQLISNGLIFISLAWLGYAIAKQASESLVEPGFATHKVRL